MRADEAPPGWYLTQLGRRVRVIGPAPDVRYVSAVDHAGRTLELPSAAELAADPSVQVETSDLVGGAHAACPLCGWTGALEQRVRRRRASVWVLPGHLVAATGLLCRAADRTLAEAELLDLDRPWQRASTARQRVVIVRSVSDVEWLARVAEGEGLQREVAAEIVLQLDALRRVSEMAASAPALRAARRRADVRARPGVRAHLEQLIVAAAREEAAQRLAADRVRAQRVAFRRRAGVEAPARLYPIPGPPTPPDPLLDELVRGVLRLAPQLVVVEVVGLDLEARALLDEHPRCPLTALDWTVERLAVVATWGRPLTAAGVLAASRSLVRAGDDPTPWVRRLDPETRAYVLLAAAARAAEAAEVLPAAAAVRGLALTSLSPLAPESAGALLVRGLRSLWAAGIRAEVHLSDSPKEP